MVNICHAVVNIQRGLDKDEVSTLRVEEFFLLPKDCKDAHRFHHRGVDFDKR